MSSLVHNCGYCNKSFVSKKNKRFCCKECYFLSREQIVKICCSICNIEFFVPYRFREKKTCSKECTKVSISKTLSHKKTKQCLQCNNDFDVTKSCEEKSKYCSSACFYTHRYKRDSTIVDKICEACGKEFKKDFIKRSVRFCSRSCATSESRNGMYGKKGTMTGKAAWNNGLTAKSDPRLFQAGRKISEIRKKDFSLGIRSNKGEKNPMFGHTRDLLTTQQRENYSKAAIQRVLSGVSGYKTGHLSGIYKCKKSINQVKFKSSWELAAMMWWDRCENIKSYDYEQQIIELPDGRRSIPDFRVVYTDGNVKIFEIKPTAIQNLISVKEKLNLVKESIKSLGLSYELLGDYEINLMIKELGEDFKNEVKRYQDRK